MIAVYRVAPSACLRARIVAMVDLEVTSYSCHLYVTSATRELPEMPGNRAETPESKEPGKIGVSDDFSRGKLDRRISVAPMMDWTDEVYFASQIRALLSLKMPCLLYVSS